MSPTPARSDVARYGLAVGAVALATAVRVAFDPLLGDHFPFATLFLAVLVVARFAGFGPAVAATLLGVPAAAMFLLHPRGSLAVHGFENQAGLAVYVVIGLGVAALGGAMAAARRRAEADAAAAAGQREQLRTTLASIGDAVITTDGHGRVTSLNAVAEHLTGWPAAEAAGRPLDEVFRIVNEETRRPVENPAARALREGTVVGLANHTVLIARDGTERPIDDSAAPIRDAAGAVSGVVLVFRDVGDRRRAEEDRLRLAAIVASSDDAIIGKDLDGAITSWNAGAERLYGYAAAEMVGRPFAVLIPPDREGEVAATLRRLRAGDRVEHFETVRVRKDGRRVDVSVSYSPVHDDEGRVTGAAVIARDITARKQADRRRDARLAVAQILAERGETSDTLGQLVEVVGRGLDWDIGIVWMADAAAGVLRCADVWQADPARTGAFAAACGRATYGRDDGLPGRVWASGRPLWIPDAAADDRFTRRSAASADGVHGALACPVVGRGAVLGVIEFFSRQVREPDPDLLEMMATFGGQVGQLLERKRAREELRRSERELVDFFENATIGLHWVGPDGTILRVNKAELALLGYAKEEYVGHNIAEFHADDSAIGDILRRLTAGEELRDYPARMRCKDGSVKDVLIDSSVKREDGRFVHTRCFTRDVTEQKKAEAARREAEARLRAVVDNSPATIFLKDPAGRYLLVNRRFEELARAAGIPGPYLGRTDAELLPPAVAAQFARDDREVLATKRVKVFEEAADFGDEPRVGLTTKFPLLDATGEAYAVCGISFDITARKRAEEALRESEERLRLALEAGRMGVWDWDVPTGAVRWSENMEAIHGLAPGTFAGTFEAFRELIHPDDRGRVVAEVGRALEERTPYEAEFRTVWPDGTVHWIAGRGRAFYDAGGRPVRMTGIGTDVTARKRAEQDAVFLARASAALASVVDETSALQKVAALAVPTFADWCAVDVLTDDGALRRVAVAHADPEKVELAHELHRRFPPDPAAPQGVWQIARTGRPELVPDITDDMMIAAGAADPDHLRVVRELGLRSYMGVPVASRGKVLGVMTFIAAESGRRYDPADLAVAEDLAGRAAVAVENARLYQALREADRKKDEFLAVLGHELRNPLAPVRNGLHILRRPGVDPAAVERTTAMMERQVEHLVRLVDDLLDVSRIMRGKIELRRGPVDLAAAVARAVETVRPAADVAGHDLTVDLPAEPVVLDGDLVRLSQVVGNLLANAVRYTDPGGAIRVTAGREDGAAVVRVRDTGIGIRPELLPRVFDMFVQADHRAGRAAQGGLGIGLTLVKSLVELHGGTVEAHSAGPGKGSEFVVRLPLPKAGGGGPVNGHGAGAAHPSPVMLHPARKVLVVDDNVDAAESLAVLLRLAGHDVRVAHGGPEALDLAAADPPDVAFLDLGMPGMDGLELARRFRQDPRLSGVLLVALTGWGQEEDRRRTREAGFDHHFTKPAEPEAINRLFAGLTAG